MTSLTTGSRLGSYEIVSLVGAGGMGEVYRAKDTKLGRDVALKMLPASFTNDPERVARFRREAQVLASLNHPHIAQIYGLEEANGAQFLVLELVDGESLDKRIARGPLPVDEAVGLAKQIAEALEAAHEKGIIHRDLKPANIALTKDGSVKVLDFGLAKAIETTSRSLDAMSSPTITSPAMLTGIGLILGTAAYMSPEQAKGQAVDRRSDIWAFGCVLYEMLTGDRPFKGEDIADTVAQVLTKEPNWAEIPADASTSVRKVLRRCLEKDRKRRLADAADLRFEIDDALTSSAADAQPAPPRRVRSILWASTASAFVIGVTASTLMFKTAWLRSADGPAAAQTVSTAIRFMVPSPDGGDFASAHAKDGAVAVSPDGRWLAFTTSTAGIRRLWIRPIASLDAREVSGSDGAVWPFWSADSQSLAFFVGDKLKAIDRDGSQRTICEVPGRASLPEGDGGAWSQSGEILFGSGVIYHASTRGGAAKPVTSLNLANHELLHMFPTFLPDGRHFLYVAGNELETDWALYAASLDGGAPVFVRRVETANVSYADGRLLFSGAGAKLLAQKFNVATLTVNGDPVVVVEDFARSAAHTMHGHFSVSQNGVLAYQPVSMIATKLVWVDRAGRRLSTIAAGGATYANPAVAPNGQRVAVDRFERATGLNRIWVFDVSRGSSYRLNRDGSWDLFPVWTRDSEAVVFAAAMDKGRGLFKKQIDTSASADLLHASSSIEFPTSISRDTKTVVYKRGDPSGSDQPGTGLRAFILRTGSSRDERIDGNRGHLSPDDRWLAYESGGDIYVKSLDKAGVQKIASVGGGSDPRWRADGRELFYVNGQTLMGVAVGTAPALTFSAPTRLFRDDAWAVGMLPSPAPNGSHYDVAPDGQRFLLNVRDPAYQQSPLTVIVNWEQTLNGRDRTK